MLRSEDIECVLMYYSSTGLKDTIRRLGDASIVQFREGKAKNNNFDSEIKTVEAVEQKLNYLRDVIETCPCSGSVSEHTGLPHLNRTGTCGSMGGDSGVESTVEIEIQECYLSLVHLRSSLKLHLEHEEVLEQNIKMVEVARSFIGSVKNSRDLEVISFDFLTAISDKEKKLMIRKMVRHRLRRNVYIKTVEYKHHAIFIIYVLGTECTEYVKNMVEDLGGRTFDSLSVLRESTLAELKEEHGRLRRSNAETEAEISTTMAFISKNIAHWEHHVNREKKSLLVMSKLVQMESTSCYCSEGWVVRKDLERLSQLKSFDTSQGRFIFQIAKPGALLSEFLDDGTEVPRPTYFCSTEFTRPFQNLTNVFGIPKYKEINPAIFMTFTFPFLFGAMFGDILHGMILMAIGCYLIYRFGRLNGRCGAFQTILEGRYVIIACAFAAIWFGLLYGDFGSLSFALFPSGYRDGRKMRTYLFGIDPVWHHASNKMIFINSMKMKLSLIIGFAHMGLGSLISISNSLFFRDRVTLICVAIPQCLAFFLFLGYLVFLCVYKWLVTVTHPSLVNTMITMYTDPFNMSNQMYPGQLYVQLLILSMILICMPWMLLGKPIYLMSKRRVPRSGMLDLWITSGIHVVEFCLGLISNTSSYLRLWAVSLAHVQLTSVLHEFTLGSTSWTVKVLTFPIYLSGTIMLLIGLEGLSSCLHALRLNWIEFFSKFYSGGGEMFKPFNFSIPEDE